MSEQGYAALGILAGVTATLLLVGIVMWVLLVIARWKIFTKAGEAGWKSIIPIYSDYVMYKLVWDTTNFWIYLALVVVGSIFSTLGSPTVTVVNGEVIQSGGNMFLMILCYAAVIAGFVWYVRASLKTAAAFGKGVGFAVGLILLPNIFTLILGFGSDQYIGPQA